MSNAQIRRLLVRKGELLRSYLSAGEDRRKEIDSHLKEIDAAIFRIRSNTENVIVHKIKCVA